VAIAALPFIVYTGLVLLRRVVSPGMINEARLLASGSVFLLIAHAWSGVYAAIELVDPGSFERDGTVALGSGDLTYLSFVTQTTLGYGDVVPATPVARAAATLHASAGLFYMAVVVARFAGQLQLSGRMDAVRSGGPLNPTSLDQS
jgi:hypothetical protein